MRRPARRCRLVPALALCLLGLSEGSTAEEVLLLLPKNFDVQPIRGWSRNGSDYRRFEAKDVLDTAHPFQFRGEAFTQTFTRTDHHTFPDCTVVIDYDHEYQGTFRRGVLEGRWVSNAHNFNRGCKDKDDGEYLRVRYVGVVKGQANADGLLKVTVQVTEGECVDHRMEWVGQGKGGRFVFFNEWKRRPDWFNPWSFGFEFQLPVGELQSSQKLSTPSPGRPKNAAQGVERNTSERVDESSGAGEDASPRRATSTVRRGASKPSADGNAADESRDSSPAPEDPVTPGETAAATVGSGLLAGLGAWLLARANGAGLGDLAGGLLGETPPPAPPEPPRLLFQEPPHADGERNDRGEVWDARLNGWVGENLYQQDRQREAWLEGKAKTDLQAMRQPDATSELAREIAASDRSIEAHRQSIAARDAEIRNEEQEIREREEALGRDPLGQKLEEHFNDTQRAMSEEGYRVVNPAYDQAYPVRFVIDGPMAVVGAVTPGFKPVRCKEMAEIGADRLQKAAAELFGEDADRVIVDTVKVDVVREGLLGPVYSALDFFAPKDHGATRVTLPDGRRFILDHWEAGRHGVRQIKSEAEWLKTWKGRLGEDMRYFGGKDNAGLEDKLESQVPVYREKTGGSREQAIDFFRTQERHNIETGAGTPEEKARRLKRLETTINSYTRSGSFRSPGTQGRE